MKLSVDPCVQGVSSAAGLTRCAIPALVLAVSAFSTPARAEVEFKPYAEAEYAHVSNVFALRQEDIGLIEGDTSDSSLSYGAGFDLTGNFGRQQLVVTARGLRTEFDQFTQLDHNEYAGNVAWNWKVGRALDGTFGYETVQRMVPFADTGEVTNQLLLEQSRQPNVALNIAISPVWRLQTRASWTELESPRRGAPSLEQDENVVTAGIRYVGRARLSAGLDLTKTDGEVTGLQGQGNSTYDQSAAQLVAEYSSSGKSTFNGTIGYTKRDDAVAGDVDATTGGLRYTRALTRKTSVFLEVSRELSSYLRNDRVESELATGFNAGVNWQATAKTGLGLTFGYQESKFPERVVSETAIGRKDQFEFSELHINYQVTRWLLIHPFIRYDNRDSNDPVYDYDNTYVALHLKISML